MIAIKSSAGTDVGIGRSTHTIFRRQAAHVAGHISPLLESRQNTLLHIASSDMGSGTTSPATSINIAPYMRFAD